MVEAAGETVTSVDALDLISGFKDDDEEEVAVFELEMILRVELLDVDGVAVIPDDGKACEMAVTFISGFVTLFLSSVATTDEAVTLTIGSGKAVGLELRNGLKLPPPSSSCEESGSVDLRRGLLLILVTDELAFAFGRCVCAVVVVLF